MTSATQSLKDLHQLHLEIEQAQQELKRGPVQLKARENIAGKREAELQQYQEEFKQLKMMADTKSLDLKTTEKKVEDLKAKLNVASSNREFDAIKMQIQADETALSVLEDEVLEYFERIDEESGKRADYEKELEDARQESIRFAEQFSVRSSELNDQLETLQQKLQAAEKMLPSEPLALYRRLVTQKGAKAMAKVKAGACSNCFVSITAQQKILINTGAFEFCTNCGSLLYHDENEVE